MMNETEPMEGIAGAVNSILAAGETAGDAAHRVIDLEVEDRGEKLTIPVAILPGPGGVMVVAPMVAATREGIALARQARLDKAPGPDRRDGTVDVQSFADFCGYAEKYATPTAVIFADGAARRMTAILDYHEPGADGKARWGRQRAVYGCPLSDQWRTWGAGAEKTLDQEALAKFLDANDRDLTDERPASAQPGVKFPAPAALISLANSLESYSASKAKRERTPDGKIKLAYSSESGFTGDLTPPPAFAVKIRVFSDGEPEVLEVRLRAEVKEGAASFTLGIHAPGDVLRAAFEALICEAKRAAGLPVFGGVAPEPPK